MSDDTPILPPGTIIGGKYEILKMIDKGGMSIVYLVMDTHLNKNWALKEVRRDDIMEYTEVRHNLMVETEMLKRLDHPNLPRIVDVIEEPGVIYIVMDYIEGRTLKDILIEYGAQPQEDVIEWGKQLCDVLNYLHTRKPAIIYRDMKPGNVMLKPEGGVVLFDFGIAREFKERNLEDTQCLGTPGYAAPEQFGGMGQTDQRTDIYGLGATLYHLVTGKPPSGVYPFEMKPIREINPRLSSGLEEIIIKCTKNNPNERYQNSAELMYALQNYNHFDSEYRKRLKRRVTAFAVPFTLSILCFGFAVFCYRNVLAEMRNNYNTMLTQATDMATQSVYNGEYDQKVLDQFTNTIEIDPAREEAYLRLMDYCSRIGETQTGLNTVCTRIDSGTGNIDKNNDVVLRVAQTYFDGNDDPNFSVNYMQAAKYFAKVNEKEVPEAKYFSELSQILGSFSSGTDWERVNEILEDFVSYNKEQVLSEEKIRNYQLTAGVYTANKRDLSSQVDPYEKAIDLLESAKSDVEDLLEDVKSGENAALTVEGLTELQAQIINDLATAYYTAYTINSPKTDYDKSIEYYTQLVTLLDNDEEIKNINFQIAAVCRKKGDGNQIKEQYESLISRYSDDASVYLEYASYLFDQAELEKATELFREAQKCSGYESDSNYQKLDIKLRNAGVIE